MLSSVRSFKAIKYINRAKSAYALEELKDVGQFGAIIRQKEKWAEIIKEKYEKAARTEIARKLRVAKEYYKVEMAPPRPGELKQIMVDIVILKEFISTKSYRNLTVRQAWLLFLVGTEIYMWFYLGETFGKMHIVGYKVKASAHHH